MRMPAPAPFTITLVTPIMGQKSEPDRRRLYSLRGTIIRLCVPKLGTVRGHIYLSIVGSIPVAVTLWSLRILVTFSGTGCKWTSGGSNLTLAPPTYITIFTLLHCPLAYPMYLT